MPFTLTMPKLSPTMEEGTITKWHKKVGDEIKVDELILEVATDKATVEYNALDGGWLRQIIIKEGESAVVNQAIAIMTEEKAESIEGYQPTGVTLKEEVKEQAETEEKPFSEASAKKPVKSAATPQQAVFVPEPALENYEFSHPTTPLAERVFASPLAKRLAKEKGLDLTTVKGSGPNQRITSEDLVEAQPAGDFAFGHREHPIEVPGSYVEEPLSPMRKVIGQRLQDSKSYIPHFYVQQGVDASALIALREQLKTLNLKVSVNDCVIRACALALRKHPGVNAGFNSVTNSIIQFKTIDISVAVGVNGGLITPIVRHADYKNLGELSLEVRGLAGRAKEGKLNPQEYRGGSFTISNLGMYGVTNFQAIINPPQAAILAISGIQDTPVVKDGVVVAGKVMNVTLSVDHRVVDGVLAVEFIKTVQHYLENPVSLVL